MIKARRDARSHHQREEESVTSLVQMGGIKSIGMARDKRDSSPLEAKTEAQDHYLSAIENKQLIFATSEAGPDAAKHLLVLSRQQKL